MIQRIDIKNFGSFSNFAWNAQIKKDGNIVDFKKLNILYGRNYSGKTTLSRMVRCLETGELPANYALPEFSIKTDTETVSHTGITAHKHHVRVFNKDFVDDNLSFLRDDEGKVEPFAVLGGENTKIEKEIEEKEEALGSAEKKAGLRSDEAQKKLKWEQKVTALNKAKDSRTESLRNKARELKQSPSVYGDINYDIRKIETDISEVQKQGVAALSQEEEDNLRRLLKQDSLPEVKQIPGPNLRLEELRKAANALLTKEIKPSKPIQDLLDDALLQTWVKQGIPLHQVERTTCGFCGNPLPGDLWEKLDQHFSKESKDLDDALTDLLGEVESEDSRAQTLMPVKKEDLYPTLHPEYEAAETTISELIQSYSKALKAITSALKKRQADLFRTQPTLEEDNVPQELGDALSALTPLIEKHKKTTEGLASEQTKAKKTIRLSELSAFITTISLSRIEADIATLSNEANELQTDAAVASKLVIEQEKAIEELRKKLRDERRGAEKVNEYLSHFFGHDSLKLVAIEEEGEEQGIRFEINRGDNKAYNLSDGECSLIAFCYFMAKLQSAESEDKNLIIYIDDPISSLDSDHIFFVFSLIQSLLAAPTDDSSGSKIDRYKQLFISTHNLDFLKFLKRLIRPQRGGNEHFILVRTENGSLIELMPFYLRHYVTEFHYLFDQVCACTDPEKIADDHHCFFNFGNNLRKFLEVYLFFRFPVCENSNRDQTLRIEKFLEGDPISNPLVQRLTNELSHVGEIFDRSLQPLDHAEVSKMARFILGKIATNDRDQYEALLQATQRSDPLLAP